MLAQCRLPSWSPPFEGGDHDVAMNAASRVRTHLARELHDGLGHFLTAINVQLEKALAFRLIDPVVARQALCDAARVAGEALQDVQGSTDALASTLSPFSLVSSLRSLVENVAGDTAIDLRVTGEESEWPKPVLLVLYRAVQEALTNIQKHAQATSVGADLHFDTHIAHLCIVDDGRGFDTHTVETLPSDREGGYGLQGMRERLDSVGGALEITSRPGSGTHLHVRVPKDASRDAQPAPLL